MKLTFSTFWSLALSSTTALFSAPTEIPFFGPTETPLFAPAANTEALYPRANRAHQNHDLTAAIPLYRAALVADPDLSKDGQFLGRFAGALEEQGGKLKDVGLLTESIDLYEKWTALAPQDPVAHFNLGVAIESLDALAPSPALSARALITFQAALALAPGDFRVQHKVGNSLMVLQRYSEAEVCYRAAIRLDRKPNPHLQNMLGMALFRQSRWPEAEAEFRQAFALLPEAIAHPLNVGASLLKQGKRAEATPYVQTARHLGLKDHWSIKELGLENTPVPSAPTVLAPVAISPTAVDALQAKANAAYAADHYAEAEPLFTQLIELAPDHAGHYALRGYSRLQLKQLELARADYTQAETLHLLHDGTPREIASALTYRAAIELSLDEPLRALVDATLAGKIDAQFGYAQMLQSNAWYALGDYDQAVQFLKTAQALDPTLTVTYTPADAARFGQGRPTVVQANEQIDDSEEEDEDAGIQADFAAGDAAYWKDHPAAITAYTRVLEKKPGNARALDNRATMYYLSEDYQRALEDHVTLVTLVFANHESVDDQVSALDDRARTYVKLSQWRAAVIDCALMKKLLPDDAKTLRSIADIERSIGDAKSPPTEAQLTARAKARDLADAHEQVLEAEQTGKPDASLLGRVELLLAQEPGNPALLMLRGRLEQLVGDLSLLGDDEKSPRYERAIATYTQAIAAAPRSAEAHARRGFVRRALSSSKGGFTYAELRADFEQALALGSIDPKVLESLITLAETPAAALVSQDRLLQRFPDRADYLNHRAKLLTQLDRPDEALAELEELSRRFPADLEQRQALAFALSTQKKPRAIEEWSRIIVLAPQPENYASRARTYLDQNQIAPALKDYDRAIRLDVTHGLYWLSQAQAKRLNGDAARAKTDYDRAHTIDGNIAAVSADLSDTASPEAELTLENLAKIREEFPIDQGIEDAPDTYGEQKLNKALTYLQEKKISLAIASCTQTIQRYGDRNAVMYTMNFSLIDPQAPRKRKDFFQSSAYHLRGRIFLSVGQPAEALLDLNRAVAISPLSATFILTRGSAHGQLKDYAAALADVDQALVLEPANESAKAARAEILELKAADKM